MQSDSSLKPTKYIPISRILVMAILVGLAIQYLLGMYVNIYAALPIGHENFSGTFMGEVEFTAHWISGYLIGIVSVAILVFSALTKRKKLTFVGSLGFLSVLVAGLSGLEFALFSPFVYPIFSYSMATAFLAAISAYLYMASLLMKRDFP